MKLTTSKESDPNYLAEVVVIPSIIPHPNADRLEIVELYGNEIIIGKGLYKVGDKVVYFPVESCIAADFLSWANLFDKPELNADRETKGFFSNKGCRVKAVRLRAVPSQGFLLPTARVADFYKIDESVFKLGTSFDTVGDHKLVTKYIRPAAGGQPTVKKSKIPDWVRTTVDVFPKPIRSILYIPIRKFYGLNEDKGFASSIVEGQFSFHYKTEQLGKNIFAINPTDAITISEKVHGTSAIFANILCKKKRFLRKETNEYTFVYASRSQIKNRKDGKYTDDVWGDHAKELDGKIPEGYSVYGEIVGYTSNNRMIQKGYDYGVKPLKSEFWVYRVTYTDPDGGTCELDWHQIEDFCNRNGLKTVPVHFDDWAYKYHNDLENNGLGLDVETWRQEFLKKLKDEFLDKVCKYCTTKVVNEGVVVRINETKKNPAFKFKSPSFVIKESAARDAGEEDMEENA